MIIQKGLWQDKTLCDLIALLEPDDIIRALLLKGSYANPNIHIDIWSDIDVIIVVVDGMLSALFPTTAWLSPLGELYTYEQSTSEFTATTRLCFADFRRIDCTIIQEADFSKQPIGSEAVRILFSRSELINNALTHATLSPPLPAEMSAEQFAQMANAFWFKGMLATTEVMHNDLLIATHLALELVQDVCVLEMMLRDRAMGTSHHREGGIGNTFVAQLHTTQYPYTPQGILESVKQTSILFDELAVQWSKDYHEHRHPLLAWIGYALEMLILQQVP